MARNPITELLRMPRRFWMLVTAAAVFFALQHPMAKAFSSVARVDVLIAWSLLAVFVFNAAIVACMPEARAAIVGRRIRLSAGLVSASAAGTASIVAYVGHLKGMHPVLLGFSLSTFPIWAFFLDHAFLGKEAGKSEHSYSLRAMVPIAGVCVALFIAKLDFGSFSMPADAFSILVLTSFSVPFFYALRIKFLQRAEGFTRAAHGERWAFFMIIAAPGGVAALAYLMVNGAEAMVTDDRLIAALFAGGMLSGSVLGTYFNQAANTAAGDRTGLVALAVALMPPFALVASEFLYRAFDLPGLATSLAQYVAWLIVFSMLVGFQVWKLGGPDVELRGQPPDSR